MLGVPDEESLPTVAENNQSTFVLSPPASSATSWQFDALFFPHPVIMGFIYASDYGGTHTSTTTLYNPRWSTDGTYATGYNSFNDAVDKYRLTYLGVTAYHDCAATANEGTLACAQYTQRPDMITLTANPTTPVAVTVTRPIESWPEQMRTFAQLQTTPNAYFGVARDGLYAPYKLTRDFKLWTPSCTRSLHMNMSQTGSLMPRNVVQNTLAGSAPAANFPYGIQSIYGTASMNAAERPEDRESRLRARYEEQCRNAATVPDPRRAMRDEETPEREIRRDKGPCPDERRGTDAPPTVAPVNARGLSIVPNALSFLGDVVNKRADGNVIHVAARNLDLTSNFTFYVRQGWEFAVLPGTPLAPHMKNSPLLDETSLRTYFAISRELKDAYPADFNDLGKILKEIANIALDVLPVLFPPAAPLVGIGRSLLRGLSSSETQAVSVKEGPIVTQRGTLIHMPGNSLSGPFTQAGSDSLSKKNQASTSRKPAKQRNNGGGTRR